MPRGSHPVPGDQSPLQLLIAIALSRHRRRFVPAPRHTLRGPSARDPRDQGTAVPRLTGAPDFQAPAPHCATSRVAVTAIMPSGEIADERNHRPAETIRRAKLDSFRQPVQNLPHPPTALDDSTGTRPDTHRIQTPNLPDQRAI